MNVNMKDIVNQFWVTMDANGRICEHENRPVQLKRKYISVDMLIRNVLKLQLTPMSCVLVVIRANMFTVLPSQDAVLTPNWYMVRLYSGEIVTLYFNGEGFHKPHRDKDTFIGVDFDEVIQEIDRTPITNSLFPSTKSLHVKDIFK